MKEGLLAVVMGVFGIVAFVGVTIYGQNRGHNVWQPMLVPIILSLALFVVGTIIWFKEKRNATGTNNQENIKADRR